MLGGGGDLKIHVTGGVNFDVPPIPPAVEPIAPSRRAHFLGDFIQQRETAMLLAPVAEGVGVVGIERQAMLALVAARLLAHAHHFVLQSHRICLLYTSPSPRDRQKSR